MHIKYEKEPRFYFYGDPTRYYCIWGKLLALCWKTMKHLHLMITKVLSQNIRPVKSLCPTESMRNRANAMNFNKKVVTKVICVKGVVFQNRHCLTFLYGYIFTSNYVFQKVQYTPHWVFIRQFFSRNCLFVIFVGLFGSIIATHNFFTCKLFQVIDHAWKWGESWTYYMADSVIVNGGNLDDFSKIDQGFDVHQHLSSFEVY